MKHPVTDQVMKPKFLGGDVPDTQGQDRRAVMAEWLTVRENPFFATSVANRIWEHFFGIGIVEPVDDVRVSNPPSNPELFRTWDGDWSSINSTSNVWSTTSAIPMRINAVAVRNDSNEQDERNFAHANVAPHPGRNAAGLHQSGHRNAGQVPRLAAGCPGRANCGRPTPTTS